MKERAERMDKKMNCMYVNLAGEKKTVPIVWDGWDESMDRELVKLLSGMYRRHLEKDKKETDHHA